MFRLYSVQLYGSSRLPLLGIGLWDDEVGSRADDDEPLAFEDVRLAEGGGAHAVKLVGRKGGGVGKHVTVHFTATVVPQP